MTNVEDDVQSVEGWLLDLYPQNENRMAFWVKTEDGKAVRLVDEVRFSVYADAPEHELRALQTILSRSRLVSKCEFGKKRVRIQGYEKSLVLRIEPDDLNKASILADEILAIGGYKKYRLFNVDVLPAQMYLYERGLFPLARVNVEKDPDILRTQDGDSFRLPYPIRRARVNNVFDCLILGRESVPLSDRERKSEVYFSYGRIYFRPAPYKLLGMPRTGSVS